MPEEPPTITEPAPAATKTSETILKDFGDLDAVFDNVFKATAEKKEPGSPESVPVADATPAPTAAVPAPPAAPADPSIPPDDIFEPAAPVEKKEFPAPDKIKNDPKQYANWNELRTEVEQLRGEVSKYQGENGELKGKIESGVADEKAAARIAELETQLRTFSERSAVLDLRNHPGFQEAIAIPKQAAVEEGLNLLKDAGVDATGFQKAIELPPGKARREALDELMEGIESKSLHGELSNVLSRIHNLDRQEKLALSNAAQNLAVLRQKQQANQHRFLQDSEKRISSLVDGVHKYLAEEKKMPFFREIPGNDAWNGTLKQDIETIRELSVKETDQSKIVGAVALGVRAPHIYKWGLSMRDRAIKAEKELAEYKSAEPGLNGVRHDASAEPDASLSFGQAVAAASGLP